MITTGISWTDSTFNPWIGCTKVGPGCDHCYAEARMDKRLHVVQWGPAGTRKRTSVANWREPVKWNANATAFRAEHGRRQRVFCASLADVFDNAVKPAWFADLLSLILATPHLDWLLLTKRIGTVAARLQTAQDYIHTWPAVDCGPLSHCITNWLDGDPPSNVWLGATVVNQAEADRDIPKLLATPARVRFLSIEPMLGPISFEGMFASERVNDGTNALEEIDWVICGGESGPGARPMQRDWARRLRDQCAAAGIPFHFKQWGEWAPGSNWPDDVAIPSGESCDFDEGLDDNARSWRVGKKAAGHLLDGVAHLEFPRAAA